MSASRVKAKVSEIVDAMGLGLGEAESYVDLRTGEVVVLFEDGDDLDDLRERLEEEPERYLHIPRTESRESWALMNDFTRTVDEDDVREMLEVALEGKGAFRRFQGVLARHPDIQARWRSMEDHAETERARKWLEAHDLEAAPELRTAPPPPPPPPAPPPRQIELLDILTLGGSKAELLDGRVPREIHAANAAEARRLLRDIARDVCAYYGVEWRKRFVEKGRFHMQRISIEQEGEVVRLWLDVPREVWEAFS